MSTFVLVSGVLHRGPERRVSSKGTPFARCTLRVTRQWWNVTAFRAEVVAELLRLQEGDALSATGPLTASIYEGSQGQGPRLSLTVVAENVISLRRQKERREPVEAAASPERPFDDEVVL
jgi:single-stranded DNA-binding protein